MAARSVAPWKAPVSASSATSGKSFTLEFGRLRGRVRACSFSAVHLSWVHSERRRLDAGEREEPGPLHDLRRDGQGITGGHVDSERQPVELAGHARLGAEASTAVDHPLHLDVGVLAIGLDDEGQPVAEV
jgi:hypothetical protein